MRLLLVEDLPFQNSCSVASTLEASSASVLILLSGLQCYPLNSPVQLLLVCVRGRSGCVLGQCVVGCAQAHGKETDRKTRIRGPRKHFEARERRDRRK